MKSSKLPPSKSTIAKGDSGASNHYFALHDADAPIHQQPSKGTVATLPDSKSLSSNVQAELPLSSNLSPTAKQVELFPHLNHNLISLGQLCDDKCVVLLDKDKLLALKMQKLQLREVLSNWKAREALLVINCGTFPYHKKLEQMFQCHHLDP